MQPSDLHCEKATPVPGWDESLWPKRGRWFLNARLERWSSLLTTSLAVLAILAMGGWTAAVSLAELGWVVVPDFLLWKPERDPYLLLVASGGMVLLATIALAAMLAMMTAKAWQALRLRHPPAPPDPDYRVIDFRARRKR
jgi:hypothetical protein